ncbi:MAG: hypothetical protein ACPHQD_04915 [Vibrio toranzoniae]|uniref:hypothetical protein n=1 Tax=Vibrio toranzoniae TaxID=1194427 RepID=UPI003C541B27
MTTPTSPAASFFGGLSSGAGANDRAIERQQRVEFNNLKIQGAKNALDQENNLTSFMQNASEANNLGLSDNGGQTLNVDKVEQLLLKDPTKLNSLVKKFGNQDPLVKQNEGFNIEGLAPGPDGPNGEKTFSLKGVYDSPEKKGVFGFLTKGGTKDRENDPVQFGTSRQVAQKLVNSYNQAAQLPGAVQATLQMKNRMGIYDLDTEIDSLNGQISGAVDDALGMLGNPLLQRQVSDQLADIKDPYERQQRLKEIVSQLPDEVMAAEQKKAIDAATAELDSKKQPKTSTPDSAKTALMTPGSTGGMSAGRSEGFVKKVEDATDKAETEEEKEEMIKAVITQEDKQELMDFLKKNDIKKLEDIKKLKVREQQAIRTVLEATAIDQTLRTKISKQFDNVMSTGNADLDTAGAVDLQTKKATLNKTITDLRNSTLDRINTADTTARAITDKALEGVMAALYPPGKDGKPNPEAKFEWNENKVRKAFRDLSPLHKRFQTQFKRAAKLNDTAAATRAGVFQETLDASISALIQGAGISEEYGDLFDLLFEPDADGGPSTGDNLYRRLGVTYDANGKPDEFFYLDPSSGLQRGETIPAAKVKRLMGDDEIYSYFIQRVEEEKGPAGSK